MKRRGRPLGEESRIVLRVLAEQPMPSSRVAETLQMSRALADSITTRLLGRGYAVVVREEPRQGRRPVRVYGAASWVTEW